jgi:hypothetical protein
MEFFEAVNTNPNDLVKSKCQGQETGASRGSNDGKGDQGMGMGEF